ncbi:MAG: hypothetical protein ABIL09_06155 [Gemmatimonadota bacterium]
MVPVLGMHRSGTSMFTRALNLLGMELGGPLMAPQPDNPKGFWENEFFWELDVRILRALGCHMNGYGSAEDLLTIPARSARVERSDANLQAIQSYLDRTFTGHVWGWKDPRTVLLFPFWLGLLADLGFRQVRPTVIARHPGACVRSLVRRGDLQPLAGALKVPPARLALEMWKAYSLALVAICDATGCYTSLHEWMLDRDLAASELRRCAQYVGLGDGVDLTPALEWVDPTSVHHSGSSGEGVDEEALEVFALLQSRAAAQRAAWLQTRAGVLQVRES